MYTFKFKNQVTCDGTFARTHVTGHDIEILVQGFELLVLEEWAWLSQTL